MCKFDVLSVHDALIKNAFILCTVELLVTSPVKQSNLLSGYCGQFDSKCSGLAQV